MGAFLAYCLGAIAAVWVADNTEFCNTNTIPCDNSGGGGW